MTRRFRRQFHADTAAQHDQVGQRHLLGAGLCSVERGLNGAQHRQHLVQTGRFIDRPALLRGKADARAIGTTALIGPAEGRGRGPGGCNKL